HQTAGPGLHRALTALWLLSPGTPMFFQGQGFAASSPFLYFADHAGELAAAVRAGRAEFMSQFRSTATRPLVDTWPDPSERETFARCKLDQRERERHREAVALHRDQLQLRREQVFSRKGSQSFDGAVLGDHAFVLRSFAPLPPQPQPTRLSLLLAVSPRAGIDLPPPPEPLLLRPPRRGSDILGR